MRIVAGTYGGRKLIVPEGQEIRPTSDKVRGAMFNVLHSMGALEEAHVLDCFCGTGALGLESLSRGARSCLFIDASHDSLTLARENVRALGVESQSRFMRGDALKLGPPDSDAPKYDLVFLDPPYRKNLIAPVIERLMENEWLAARAVIVAESAREDEVHAPVPFAVHSVKIYGDTRVSFFTS